MLFENEKVVKFMLQIYVVVLQIKISKFSLDTIHKFYLHLKIHIFCRCDRFVK